MRTLPIWFAVAGVIAISCRSDSTAPATGLVVGSITIDSGPVSLERGTSHDFTATVRDTSGAVIPVPVVWQSSVDSVARFQLNGRLVAGDTGTTVISASALGVASRGATIRVVWAGAASVAIAHWNPLNAVTPGFTLAESVSVVVTNLAGGGATGSLVSFAVTAGGGSLSKHFVTVLQNGVASAQWTLGPTAGVNTVTASVVESDSTTAIPWVANNPETFTIKSYAALAVVQGDSQTGPILSALPVNPQVRLVDSGGKARAGVPVTFTPTGNGRVTTSVASTGVNGVATPGSWILGDAAGDEQLIVTLESAKLVMHATATGNAVHYMPAHVFAGDIATCALTADQLASCLGQEPQIGAGDTVSQSTPTLTSGGVHFQSLSGGTTHFCGIANDLSIYCWGVNSLTDTTGHTVTSNVPLRLPGTTAWLQVSPGGQHNCAIASDRSAYCWGADASGQLGDNATTLRFVPQPVSGGFSFLSITAGGGHTCGIAADSTALCWGANANGQVGDGSTANRGAPTAVAGGLQFMSLAAGSSATCGLTVGGVAYCWGFLTGSSQLSPQSYAGAPVFTSLTVGASHACALDANGAAYCWGDNSSGQLGDSTMVSRAAPTPVAGGLRFTAISAGAAHTCGLTVDGAVACWGHNQSGELGLSMPTYQLTPRYIVLSVNP